MYIKFESILSIGIGSRKAIDQVLNELTVLVHQDRTDEVIIDLLEVNDKDVEVQHIFEWLGLEAETTLLENAESVRWLRLFHSSHQRRFDE